MIHHFKITAVEEPGFMLNVALDGQHTFADLHHCIQHACSYSPDQLASFFQAGKNWGKQVEITLLDMGIDDAAGYTMARTRIDDVLKGEHQRMLYVFDFFHDRSFYIELTQISMGQNQLEPSVISVNGNAPSQVLEEELEVQAYEALYPDERFDYGDVDDYTEIFGEMEDWMEGS